MDQLLHFYFSMHLIILANEQLMAKFKKFEFIPIYRNLECIPVPIRLFLWVYYFPLLQTAEAKKAWANAWDEAVAEGQIAFVRVILHIHMNRKTEKIHAILMFTALGWQSGPDSERRLGESRYVRRGRESGSGGQRGG